MNQIHCFSNSVFVVLLQSLEATVFPLKWVGAGVQLMVQFKKTKKAYFVEGSDR